MMGPQNIYGAEAKKNNAEPLSCALIAKLFVQQDMGNEPWNEFVHAKFLNFNDKGAVRMLRSNATPDLCFYMNKHIPSVKLP